MEKWEYVAVALTFDINTNQWTATSLGETIPIPGNFGVALNHWGEQGWEAVNFAPVTERHFPEDDTGPHGWSATAYHVLFKRRKP